MAKRDGFSGKIGFILASAGAAVGLGNIWKFPFEVARGGGALFLLVYLVICFFVCWPIMLSEVSIGRSAQRDAVDAFHILGSKKWTFIGKLGVVVAVLVLSFYNVIAGWAFGYFLEMIKGNFSVGAHFSGMINDIFSVNLYALCFMLTTAWIVSGGIAKGIERVTRIMMPLLLLMIICMGIYAMTLPYAGAGLKFYLLPDVSKLSWKVVYSAVGQAFFSLGLGLSAMITYGSYLAKKQNIVGPTFYITLADVSVAFLAGFMVFPFVAFLNAGDMSNIQAGPSLLFITLPQVFASLGGILGIVVGSLFFALICVAALTSTVSLLEIPVAYAVDALKVPRRSATFFIAIFIFLLGIPSSLSFGDSTYYTNFISYMGSDKVYSFLDFVSNLTDTGMTFGGLLIAIFVVYVWRKRKLSAEISSGDPNFAGSFLEKYVNFALTYLCPALLLTICVARIIDQFF